MLKKDNKANFAFRNVGYLPPRKVYRFWSGMIHSTKEWEEKDYFALMQQQQIRPVQLMWMGKRQWWAFKNEFYIEDEGYTEDDFLAIILDKIHQKERKIERAKARLNTGDKDLPSLRQPIPDDVKMFVWQRDGGRCVKCGSNENLEFDHIIPIAKGGSNTARNIQLLCETCNRTKGANLF